MLPNTGKFISTNIYTNMITTHCVKLTDEECVNIDDNVHKRIIKS